MGLACSRLQKNSRPLRDKARRIFPESFLRFPLFILQLSSYYSNLFISNIIIAIIVVYVGVCVRVCVCFIVFICFI